MNKAETLKKDMGKPFKIWAYKHEGFWQCIDDLRYLESLWEKGMAPCKTW
jgi:glucose-1-phosphate cytidylyltransferase